MAAWNIEYRRIGIGGGWPGTFLDVAAAMDALASKVNAAADHRLDLTKVASSATPPAGTSPPGWPVGTSWRSARSALAKVTPVGYVAQAGVLDLVAGQSWPRRRRGRTADGRLAAAVPGAVRGRLAVRAAPFGVPGTLVHGLDDDVVPISQSDTFAARAKQLGDNVTEVRMPGVDHFMLIDPTTPAWAVCRNAVLEHLSRS